MTDEIREPEEKAAEKNEVEGTIAEEAKDETKAAGPACGNPAEGGAGADGAAGGWLDAFICGIRNCFTGRK